MTGIALSLIAMLGLNAQVALASSSSFGVIRGVVEDRSGRPIGGAVVTVFRDGANRALRHITTDADGTFSARFLPGTYSLLAVATGFSTSTSDSVRVSRAQEVVYRFNLEPLGSGKTVPEKRRDRSDSKWAIRAAQNRRSVFQLHDDEADEVATKGDGFGPSLDLFPGFLQRKGSAFEIAGGEIASGGDGSINFATLYGFSEGGNVLLTGQYSRGLYTQSRFETAFRLEPSQRHTVTINAGLRQATGVDSAGIKRSRLNLRLSDEHRVGNDLVLIFGFDYNRLLGDPGNQVFAPRFGVTYDLNPRTRIRSSIFYVSPEEDLGARSIAFEGQTATFFDPTFRSFTVSDDSRLQRSNRFEFGMERLIGRQSSIESMVFLDLTDHKQMSFVSIPLVSGQLQELFGSYSGDSVGARIIYSTNVNSKMKLAGGYSFGFAPRIGITDLDESGNPVLASHGVHSFFAQLITELGTETYLRTIVRLSPEATIYAVDPFLGRIAVYDPGVSFVLTRILPNMGLPIRAEASIDARNIFDQSAETVSDETRLRFTPHRRILKGGILVRF